MPARRDDLDGNDLIERYTAGESLHALSKRFGVDRTVVRRALREHSIQPRGKAETIPLTYPVAVDLTDLARRYLAGESVKGLSRSLGLTERRAAGLLRSEGVQLRGQAEANALMAAELTIDQHRARTQRWASEWTRPLVLGPAAGRGSPAAATTREATRSKQAGDEVAVRAMLPSGWVTGEQVAVDSYNLDLAHGSVAVEIHSSAGYPLRQPLIAGRAVHLADRGWHVAYLWLCHTSPLSGRGVAELVAHVERMDRDPSPQRQYVVVRGGGEVVSAGHLDPQQRAIVPAPVDP